MKCRTTESTFWIDAATQLALSSLTAQMMQRRESASERCWMAAVQSFGDWWHCSNQTVHRFNQARKSLLGSNARARDAANDEPNPGE